MPVFWPGFRLRRDYCLRLWPASAESLAAAKRPRSAPSWVSSFAASPWFGLAMPAERLTLASRPRPSKSMKE